MKKLLTLVALAVTVVAPAEEPIRRQGDACPRWVAVLPLNKGNAASIAKDAAALGEETFIDGIAWLCALHPEGTPPTDKAAIYAALYRESAENLRKLSSVKQGVLLQSTVGHGGWPPPSPAPFQLAVPPDATSKTWRVCPLDRAFLAYIARTCRTLNELKPDFFMVDDDTRLVWSPTAPGCFCPLHLARLAEATGRAWTREQAGAKLRSGDAEFARVWDRIKFESLAELFRTIRANFDANIPGILCAVPNDAHMRHGAEYAALLAAPGQTPVIRGGGAPYHNHDDLHVLEMRCAYAQQMEKTGRKAIFMHEADTCPHTLWACSAVREVDHLAMLALDGVKSGKIWIARTGNNHEKRSFEVYRREFRAQRGIVEWATRDDFRMTGVVLPIPRRSKGNMFFRYLGQVGIPFRFGTPRAGDVVALDGPTVQTMDKQAIDRALSGPVLLDAAAALWLAEHGRAADLGVDVKSWSGPSIQQQTFADGKTSFGGCPGGARDLSALHPGAEALSWLFNRPRMGAEARKVAPGSVLFRNARGGTVLTLAGSLPAATEPYFQAQFYTETYRDELVKGLMRLCGGRLPGGACYRGVGSVTCITGTTPADGDVFVLNILGGDEDPAPEMAFDALPVAIERLGGDGVWGAVPFTRTADGALRLDTLVQSQRAAVFRRR